MGPMPKSPVDRLRKLMDDQGTLHVLRVGLEMMGLKAPLKLAQFRPALAMNPELEARYAANRLRVVRQVRTNHDDIIDLVLFLNGIPVATAELKSEFTQGINEAVDQYKFDRIPKPKGKTFAEPLLDFPVGAGALCRHQPHGDDDDQAARPQHLLPALQHGRPWRGGQPAQPARATAPLPVGAGVAARQLAGDHRPLPGDQARRKKKHHWHPLSPLPPARRHPQAGAGRAGRRCGAEVPDSAQRGQRQDQLDCLDGALLADLHDAATTSCSAPCWW